jgi:hypothetical protein
MEWKGVSDLPAQIPGWVSFILQAPDHKPCVLQARLAIHP